ncbi:MAG TPA: hypothetical protein VFR81_26445 [Longimicrobium sp.]|nr:hypothetical protein [Longimicrobium sp.]
MTLHHSRTGTPANESTPANAPGVFRFATRPTPPSAAARYAPRDLPRPLAADPSAAASGTRGALAAELRRSEHLPGRLRQALALACESERPICTVGKLAAMAGCDRRTLWNQWRNTVGREAPVRLEDFLHWQLLLRAMVIKEPTMAWADVADRLGVHPHTVARLARQLAGRTLRELNACSASTVAAEFEGGFLPQLFPNGREERAYEPPARRAS